jgi:magnesium-protoporphyrin O-methyltransferase
VPCSQCDAIEQQFDDREARRQVRRLRRRGPARTTRLLIDAIRHALGGRQQQDLLLLDIGAGIGAIHHELLDGTVARAIHVDASTAHIAAARSEADRRGHGSQVEFTLGDFATLADTIPDADVVTLDRVICCYPDVDLLVSRSAAKARRVYGAVFPRRVPWMRAAIWSVNLFQRARGSAFRVFMHDPARIDTLLRAVGLYPVSRRPTLGWEVVVYAIDPRGH